MGAQIPENAVDPKQLSTYDKDCDPAVIERRTQLFNQYVIPYVRMIYKLTAKYSNHPQNIPENYVDVMLNFYRRIETYNPECSIRTWLHICVKRQVWASEKSRSRHNNKDYDNDIEDYADTLIDETHIGSNALSMDNWRTLFNQDIVHAMDKLAPKQRDALILQAMGCSLKEIAAIEFLKGNLGSSDNIGTIKSRLRVARQHLKLHITRDGCARTS